MNRSYDTYRRRQSANTSSALAWVVLLLAFALFIWTVLGMPMSLPQMGSDAQITVAGTAQPIAPIARPQAAPPAPQSRPQQQIIVQPEAPVVQPTAVPVQPTNAPVATVESIGQPAQAAPANEVYDQTNAPRGGATFVEGGQTELPAGSKPAFPNETENGLPLPGAEPMVPMNAGCRATGAQRQCAGVE